MMHTVTATIQAPGNDPVEIRWYTGTDALQALVAAGQAMQQDTDDRVPASVRPTVLAVHIDIKEG